MMREIGIGLIGLGTVGTGVVKLLEQNRDLLQQRTGVNFKLRKICVRDLKKGRGASISKELLTTQVEDVLKDPKVDVVIELMGGIEPAGRYVMQALQNGKQVVTANKALLAEKGAEIFQVARDKGRMIGFEASVAGGIPILKALREGLIANRILEIYGIINGTANFILSEMTSKGTDFESVLKVAQKEGYAEQDPRFDIEGIDAAQKLSILVAFCYGVEPPKNGIFVEGITHITPLDIDFAQRLGYVIKLLAISKEQDGRIEARVHPTMVPKKHPLADVNGVFNAIFLRGDAVGEMMFMGRGAGMMPTASAVVSDLAMVGQAGEAGLVQSVLQKSAKIQPMEELSSEYYLRFSVVDKPGVLAQIAKHLGDHQISIASVYQPERDVGAKVPIVIMTHRAQEKNIRRAIGEIDQLDSVLDKTRLIRVERFEDDKLIVV